MFLDSRTEQSLDPEDYFSATTFVVRSKVTILVVLERMVEGRSRVRASGVLAFIMQVRLQYNYLRYSMRLVCLVVHFFS